MRYTVDVTPDGTFWHKDGTDILHREGGPAVEWSDGSKSWYNNGTLHREGGPAIECADGSTYWYVNGALHRADGPAAVWYDKAKFWYVDGVQHREDGPAIEWADGRKCWALNGEHMTEQKFLERIAPAKELTIAEIEQLLGYRVKVVK